MPFDQPLEGATPPIPAGYPVGYPFDATHRISYVTMPNLSKLAHPTCSWE
jgi:hypothetical protein